MSTLKRYIQDKRFKKRVKKARRSMDPELFNREIKPYVDMANHLKRDIRGLS